MAGDADDLRAALVARLRANGWIRSGRVEAAFAAVARHAFLPQFALADVYADRPITIKHAAGVPISASSQPAIMAEMLERLALRAGDRVLEIGTGSGYNAALLAELVGRTGSVTTIDIEADLVGAARAALDAAGYAAVRTLCGDGAAGAPQAAPFDAIVATVGAAQVPSAWFAQLRQRSRLVVPLAFRLNQRVVTFVRGSRALTSTSVIGGSFMMLRGNTAATGGTTIELGDPALRLRVLAAHADAMDAVALTRALHGAAHDVTPAQPLAVAEASEPFALWLAVHDDAFCRLDASGPDSDRGPWRFAGVDALLSLTLRRR